MMSQAAVSAFHPNKILVPMDFSPSSIAALETASELAQLFHAELHLLHVIPMFPIVADMEFSTSIFPQQEYLADAQKDAAKRLAGFTKGLADKGVRANPTVEIGNDVVGNILLVLEREHADMLIISTHGMTGWRPVVFGSIAEKVVKLVECPLLLLRTLRTKDEHDLKAAK